MIPTLAFGRSGHESTRLVFGGAALARSDEAGSRRALELLLEHGINHIDVAAAYGDAELWVGRWMPEHRDAFFLASKTGERDYAAAREQIRRSLERLRVAQLDLIQLHNLVKEEEWEHALSERGALRAAVEARDEGLVRFIGVTGHGTRVARMHLRSLERYAFDSVLLPCNFTQLRDEDYARDFEELLALCRERGVAVQTIKSIARRRWDEGAAPTHSTWYEPLEAQADIDRAVAWALARPGIFVNTASDLFLLERMIAAAERWARDGRPAAPADAPMRAAADALGMAPIFIRGRNQPRGQRARPPTA
jgi:aryl-alcohol dehydrogenase-like predicted oxidoreductase